MPEIIGGIVRAVLASVGGGLIADGVVTSDQLNSAGGAVVILLTILWSVIQKRLAAKKPDNA